MENRMDAQILQEFIESLDGAAILDQAGAYTYVSPGWEQYIGISANEAIGKKVWDLVPDTHAREVYKTGKPVFAEVVKTNGIPAFTSYFPRLGEDGSVIGVFLYIMFQGMNYALDLNRRISTISSKLEYYKAELSRERGARYSLDNIIGKSQVIQSLKERIIQTANSSSTVLIEGETGSGKELIAHSIHALSPRRTANFVRVNCSAIPAELMESEFFGYAPGAFTGATKKGKIGRFELADGGSIFLDEVNLLSPTMQPKFLRTLQEKEIDPVGGSGSIPIDVRVIAASNIPLETLVDTGVFRKDLYYRLNVICIHAPALREHMEDFPLLVDNLISRLNYQLGTVIQGITQEALSFLMGHTWPGNIRELQNAIESAINMTQSSVLQQKDFYQLEKHIKNHPRQQMKESSDFLLRPAKQALEKELIQAALENTKGNRVKAAELLGISRTVLYDKMEIYHIK